MQPPEGYDTHWSRLIDAGLAGLLFLFGLFTDGASAERLMRGVVAAALAVADDRRHGGDRLARRRPGSRDGGAVARAGRRAGLSAVHAGPHRPSQRPDRADDARPWPRPSGRIAGDGARPRPACSPARRWPSASKRCPISPAAARCSRCAMCSTGTAPAISFRYGRWLTASSIAGFFVTIGAAALAAALLRQHRGQHACRRDLRRPDAGLGRLAEASRPGDPRLRRSPAPPASRPRCWC